MRLAAWTKPTSIAIPRALIRWSSSHTACSVVAEAREPLPAHRLERDNVDAVVLSHPLDDRRGELRIGAGLAVGPGQAPDEALALLVLFDRQPQRRERLVERPRQGEGARRRAQVDPSLGRDWREPVPLDHDLLPDRLLEAAEADERHVGVGRQASRGSREWLVGAHE